LKVRFSMRKVAFSFPGLIPRFLREVETPFFFSLFVLCKVASVRGAAFFFALCISSWFQFMT